MIAVEVVRVYTLMLLTLFIREEHRNVYRKIIIPNIEAHNFRRQIRRNRPSKVIFVGFSYELSLFLLASWLRKDKLIDVIYYINRPFVKESDSLASNVVLLSNKWALQAHRNSGVRFLCDSIGYTHNIYYSLVPVYSSCNLNGKSNRVAIYCSGAYARLNYGFHENSYSEIELKREHEFLERVRFMAVQNPHISFTLFPHPSVETEDSAREAYGRLVEYENIEIASLQVNAMDMYNEYELGIARLSNTIFERVEAGHKGLFVGDWDGYSIFRDTALREVLVPMNRFDSSVVNRFLELPQPRYRKLIQL